MLSSSDSFDSLVVCGTQTSTTKKFNRQTKFLQIHEYVHSTFHSSLPNSYRILYYDLKTMAFIDLADHYRKPANTLGDLHYSTSVPLQLFIVNNFCPEPQFRKNKLLENDSANNGTFLCLLSYRKPSGSNNCS